jgi:Flp pilus assembly protein TadG
MIGRTKRTARRGTTLIETAFVITLFTMFVFGIIEFGRFLFVRQVVDNAAREAARFAVVSSPDVNLEADTQAVATQRMVGVNNAVKNYQVQVYQADSSGNKNGLAGDTPFGSNMAVQIDCDYAPVLPSFLFMGNSIHIRAKVLMNSEAN